MPQLLLFLTVFLSLQIRWLQAQSINTTGSGLSEIARKVQQLTPINYTGRQITVGSGGGFTGASTSYCLLDNGSLFSKSTRDSTYTLLGKQTLASTKRLFTLIEGPGKIKTTRFDHPGNVYKFIEWRQGNQRYKVSWGATGKIVPPAYPRAYDSFMKQLSLTSRQQ